MTDRPIIFSGGMVSALLDGRKSMTRRLAWKVAPIFSEGGAIYDAAGGQEDYIEPHCVTEGQPSTWQKVRPGDRLWVRESLTNVEMSRHGPPSREWVYSADSRPVTLPSSDPRVSAMIAWAHHKETDSAPSIHMPRWASRLTLIVTATKIERLMDISEADAIAEGMAYRDQNGWHSDPSEAERGPDYCLGSAHFAFGNLWLKLHGPGSWGANPEVVALTFSVNKQNIDTLPQAQAA